MLIVIETILLVVALSGWIIAIRKKDPSDISAAVHELRDIKKDLEAMKDDLENGCERVEQLSDIQKAQIKQVNDALLLSSSGCMGDSQLNQLIQERTMEEM